MGILIGTTLADTPAEEILLTPGKSLSRVFFVFFPSFCPRFFSGPSPVLSEKKEVKNRDMQEEHKWWEDERSFARGRDSVFNVIQLGQAKLYFCCRFSA